MHKHRDVQVATPPLKVNSLPRPHPLTLHVVFGRHLPPKKYTALSLVPRRSLLILCLREVWERAGEYLSVTSQLMVESRNGRAENASGLGWTALNLQV